MKRQLRNLIILLISLSGLSYLYRVYLRRRGPLVRVLSFHDVPNADWFKDLIAIMMRDYHVVTPDDFKAKKFAAERINILLTFDDGYQSWIDNCLPVLNKYQVKGIFFINSGLLGIAGDVMKVEAYIKERLLIVPKRPLTWEGARQLLEAGQTIGGHTVSHPNLASLTIEAAKEEIISDKSAIEINLGIVAEDFAFPFGTKNHISADLSKLVKTVYSYQYSAITSFAEAEASVIPRTLLEKNQSLPSVKKWIDGSYDILTKIKNLCVQ